ncbi:DUF4407 domain-containing protein [Actinomadura sediminis]|uniref:DUF4407 domain-containing protein n=1 Tax=Actinomadura sediminis TaxID=1038904 RepID=A0ABW3EHK8_9ACTN
MRRFLISLSGARPEILRRCPSERAKYEGIGGAVLTTSVLAALSMWFAMYSALGVHPLLAAPIALAWGAAILSLDRWLVTSIPAEGPRLKFAIPRIIMAVILGAVVSTPLVLQIFKSEIDAQIVEMKQARSNEFTAEQRTGEVGRQVAALQQQVDKLQEVVRSRGDVPLDPAADPEIRTLERQRDQQQKVAKEHYDEWQCQLYGGEGCPRRGDGPLASESERAFKKAQGQVAGLNGQIEDRKKELAADSEAAKSTRLQQATAELPKVQQQLADARERQRTLQSQFDSENAETNGLLIRLEALGEVSRNDSTLAGARILLFLFFLLIECLPVAVKLMMKPGNYDRILGLEIKREMREARAGARPGAGGIDFGAARPPSTQAIWARKDEERGGDEPDDLLDEPGDRPTAHFEPSAPSAPTGTGPQPAAASDDEAIRRIADTRTIVDARADPARDSDGQPLYDDDDY